MKEQRIKLTFFSHGGGCGCKIAPGILAEILKSSTGFPVPKELMVSIETSDDAAVYNLNDEQALIARRISLCRSLMIRLTLAALRRPMRFPIGGGHTIDSVEPIYGLVVMGLVHPSRVKRNAGAKAGDKLILGKPLGVGVLSADLKKGELDADGYATMIASTTKLNKPGIALASLTSVHSMTDVTGFGLLGHALEMARGAGLTEKLEMGNIPLLPNVFQLDSNGSVTGASERNWAGYGHDVVLGKDISPVQKTLLTDPQTSGGLRVSCTRH